MTLTPGQWTKINDGLPVSFADGSRLNKFRSQQFVKPPEFPYLIVTIASQGIPVTQLNLLRTAFDEDTKINSETYGQQCRARISAVIETLDITEAERLASLFSQNLYCRELGINPIADKMQFRGADPPQALPPYYNELRKKMVQRFNIDFFVEYEFSWIKQFPTIREIEYEFDGPSVPLTYHTVKDGTVYSLDTILAR